MQAHPKSVPLTHEVFLWLQRSKSRAITSTITTTELLVQPYRDQNIARVDELYALLSTFPHLTWVPPSLDIADLAARIRGPHGLRAPDALLAATAIHSAATGLITNDSVFQACRGLMF